MIAQVVSFSLFFWCPSLPVKPKAEPMFCFVVFLSGNANYSSQKSDTWTVCNNRTHLYSCPFWRKSYCATSQPFVSQCSQTTPGQPPAGRSVCTYCPCPGPWSACTPSEWSPGSESLQPTRTRNISVTTENQSCCRYSSPSLVKFLQPCGKYRPTRYSETHGHIKVTHRCTNCFKCLKACCWETVTFLPLAVFNIQSFRVSSCLKRVKDGEKISSSRFRTLYNLASLFYNIVCLVHNLLPKPINVLAFSRLRHAEIYLSLSTLWVGLEWTDLLINTC